MINLAFDVDGIILNFTEGLADFASKKYNLKPKFTNSPTQYSFLKRFDSDIIKNIGFSKIKDEFEENFGFENLQLMPEINIELIQQIFNHPNINSFFVTSINPKLHNQRLKNLQKYFQNIKSEQLFCISPELSKKDTLQQINAHFFIEDNLHNLYDCHAELNHQSVWIDHQENKVNDLRVVYDLNKLDEFNVKTTNHVNEAFEFVLHEALNLLKREHNAKIKI